jgi:hypothetical protein
MLWRLVAAEGITQTHERRWSMVQASRNMEEEQDPSGNMILYFFTGRK